ncbi:hypothetical protein [Polynucleobacter sp. 31A-FELB]|jgi:hypothetical protein|uniref:hypothetical protein n=1 Tax=Polynucleobacter sp. 31A-FELB TaxID=2689096 RepID=UPI001C0E57A9|nr:hypothetical protein [Polynucleobacter sp. 31A-FELB]
MDFDSSDNSGTHYSSKVKIKTFEEFQLERLIKEGKVMPASKLAEVKANELQRIKEFEEAAQEERRQRRAISRVAPQNLDPPLTRERFEE